MEQSYQGPDLSVIIPTRNRAESLRDTLQCLGTQHAHGQFSYEVVVVDNGSSDHTRRVIEELRADFPVPLRCFYEERIGRPWALNTGLREADGQFFAFTDDDVLPTPTWLVALWWCFREEEADGVTGKVLPLWMAPRPAWLIDDVVARRFKGLGCVDYGPHRLNTLEHHKCLWGGWNMAVRRGVVRRIGPYDVRMIRAQDTEYYLRCVHHGLKVVYEPGALVYHKVGAEQMTPRYLRRWRHLNGYYYAYWLPWRRFDLLTITPLWWYRKALFPFAVSWIKECLTRGPWVERFYYELRLREHLSIWLHRLQLWPRWWVTVLTGRSWMPGGQ